MPFLLYTVLFICGVLNVSAQRPNTNDLGQDEILPASKHVLPSTILVNLTKHFVRLPLHRGTYVNGNVSRTVWYILTDVSDQELANSIGLNFAPKLANAPVGCPGCVQVLDVPINITQADNPVFKGIPDFSPQRILVPGPKGFPILTGQAGAKAGLFYTPYVQPAGTNIVYNATIVAVSNGLPLNVTTHTNTHDRVLAIDTTAMTVDLLMIRAFSAGKEVIYLGLESSSEEAAIFERATFTPILTGLPFPNGDFRRDSARAAIFSFTNGQTNTTSPPAQGLNHLIIDGRNAEEASLGNTALLAALRNGGDARNVIDVFPTMIEPFRSEYSPAWDLHLSEWKEVYVRTHRNVAQTDSNLIRNLAVRFTVRNPGGTFLLASGIEVNCPVVAFVNDPPIEPVVPAPFPLPFPHTR
ncbi:MAG: hypothetical protein WA584_06130 [Pyrinomonadaceae bacterium]